MTEFSRYLTKLTDVTSLRASDSQRSTADELDWAKGETAPIESTGNWPTDQVSPLGFPIPAQPKPTGRDIAQCRWSER